MSEWVLANERALRTGTFLVVFGGMALWEILTPRKSLMLGRALRWPSNILVAVLDSLLVRLVSPSAVVGAAWLALERGWGLFNQMSVPPPATFVVTVAALDFVVYAQHVIFHHVPILWRLHFVHHADLDVDVTTGSRFHPIEILLSLFLKSTAAILLGAPPAAVLLFEALLSSTSLFNHSNVKMSVTLDSLLRTFIVTPDMHRVHHSVVPGETNSNFAFCIPWWDRLLGTYRAQPAAGQEGVVLGLPKLRDARTARLDWILTSPFKPAP